MPQEEIIELLMSPVVWLALLGVIVVLFLFIFLLNMKSKAYFIYYAIVLALGGGTLVALEPVAPELVNEFAADYKSIVSPILSVLLSKSKVIGFVCIGLAVVCIALFVVLKTAKKKNA